MKSNKSRPLRTKTTFDWLYSLCPPPGEPNINNNSKGKDDTRLGHKKLFFLEMEKKSAGCFISSLPVSPLVDIWNWKGIPDHSDFRFGFGIWMESRGKKESGFRGLINCVIMDHQQIPKCFFILSPRLKFENLWKSISTHVVPFLPKHSGICYSRSHPVKQSRTRGKDMELIGNRSQVAKAWVCKTSIRRFESDRFLQRHSIHHFILHG